MLGAIIRLADRIGVEGIGGEDVGARLGKTFADRAHQLWPSDVQQVVVATLVFHEIEPAAIILALQALGLNQGAVGAVLDQDALRGLGAKGFSGGHALALTPSKWQIA